MPPKTDCDVHVRVRAGLRDSVRARVRARVRALAPTVFTPDFASSSSFTHLGTVM